MRTAAAILLRFSRYAFVGVFGAYLIYLLIAHAAEIKTLWFHADMAPIAGGIVLLVVNGLLVPVTSRTALQLLGHSFSYRFLCKLHLENLPLRYLPGGVWQTVGRYGLLYKKGIKKRILGGLLALENGFPLSVAFIVGILLYAAQVPSPVTIQVVCLAVGVGVAVSAILLYLVPSLAIESGSECVPLGSYGVLLVVQVAFWMLQATAFVLYISSIDKDAWATLAFAPTAGSYLLSWCAGFVAIFAPQGLGVQESTFFALAPRFHGVGLTMVIASGFRVIQLCGDILLWAVIRPILRLG